MTAPARLQNARTGATHHSRIVAAGYAYPSDVVDNAGYYDRALFHVTDDRPGLEASSAMRQRRWCTPEENTWTLTRASVEMLLDEAPGLRGEIDVVIAASGTTIPLVHPPHADNPGMADLSPLVLQYLGRDDALGIDLKSAYCTGFLRGLQMADALLANPNYRAALVVAAEQGSRLATAASNRSAFSFLMGDAAGAVVLRRTPLSGDVDPDAEVGMIDHTGRTDAAHYDLAGIGPDGRSATMKGSRAGELTVALMIEAGRELLERNGLTGSDLDWFLPIQTHPQVLQPVLEALDIPRGILLWEGDLNGFSGSASIPAHLAQVRSRGVLRPRQLVLSLAVGAGLNSAGTLYRS